MAIRYASWEENGSIVHGFIEKPCDSSCPCEKARDKGFDNPATLSLRDFSPKCALQQIPRMIDRKIRYELERDLNLFSSPEFDSHCRVERKFHLDAASESVRYLANPFNTFSRKKLIHKLWNEQAARLYTEYITANAININAINPSNTTTREPTIKTLSDALQNGFNIEQLAALIADLVPDWQELNKANKDKRQTSLAGVWKRVFPLTALALTERGHLPRNISARALALLFSKHFGLSDCVKTFQNWMKPDQVSTPDYLEMANTWLDEHA